MDLSKASPEDRRIYLGLLTDEDEATSVFREWGLNVEVPKRLYSGETCASTPFSPPNGRHWTKDRIATRLQASPPTRFRRTHV
jgi:hypothetical protein